MQERERNAPRAESVTGLADAAARIATVAVVYYIAKTVIGAVKQTKGGIDEIADAWRNQAKAERDMQRTLREQDEKDTAKIRKEVSDDQVERERAKLKFRDKSVRGHWEGNVFIPTVEPAKPPKAPQGTRK